MSRFLRTCLRRPCWRFFSFSPSNASIRSTTSGVSLVLERLEASYVGRWQRWSARTVPEGFDERSASKPQTYFLTGLRLMASSREIVRLLFPSRWLLRMISCFVYILIMFRTIFISAKVSNKWYTFQLKCGVLLININILHIDSFLV